MKKYNLKTMQEYKVFEIQLKNLTRLIKYKDKDVVKIVTGIRRCGKSTILDTSVYERELRSLKAIGDNYEKIVLSMDRNFIKSDEGIKLENIIDFLIEER